MKVKFLFNYVTAREEALRKPQCFVRVTMNAAAEEFGECDRERSGAKLPSRSEGGRGKVAGTVGEEEGGPGMLTVSLCGP